MIWNEDSLLDLIGAIHFGAADPEGVSWPRAIKRLADSMDGAAVAVVEHRTPDVLVDIASAYIADHVLDFMTRRQKRIEDNLWLQVMPRLPLGVPVTLDEAMGPEVFFRSAAYVECFGPAGHRHWRAGALDWNPRGSIGVGLARSEQAGPFTADHDRLLRRVLPHLRDAALVRRRLTAALAEAEAPTALLHVLDRAAALVDASGRIAYATPAAEAVFARQDGLGLDRRGTVVAVRPKDTNRLRQLIAMAAKAGAGCSMAPGGTLSLPRPTGRPYIVQVLPLAPVTVRPPVVGRPQAALLVSDPDANPTLPKERLQQAYGLTRAEAALTTHLTQGTGLQHTADALGITANTAKAHLKAVFAKLDVDRQSALVRRVLTELGGLSALSGSPKTNSQMRH